MLAGSASLTALCLISVYLYYSRTSAGLSCQQGIHAGTRLRFGIEEQNRLIEAIYQVCLSAYTTTVSGGRFSHAKHDSKLMDRYMHTSGPLANCDYGRYWICLFMAAGNSGGSE